MSLDHPTLRGLIQGGVLVALLTLILVACGAGTGAPSPSSPAASDPAVDLPTSVPSTLSFEDLAGDLPGLAGQTVTTTAYLLIDGDQAQLCGALLESYPPQCGGGSLRLLGEVPTAVIDGLDSTSDPGQAKTSWAQSSSAARSGPTTAVPRRSPSPASSSPTRCEDQSGRRASMLRRT
jgi:hypothetical protein